MAGPDIELKGSRESGCVSLFWESERRRWSEVKGRHSVGFFEVGNEGKVFVVMQLLC